MKSLVSLYLPSYPKILVYMLQTTEYRISSYLKWLRRSKDFTRVMQRRDLEMTKPARLLLAALWFGIAVQLVIGLRLIILGLNGSLGGGVEFGVAVILTYPFVWAYLLVLPVLLGRWLISAPAAKQKIQASERFFANFGGIKIAVAGSYGKTSMKEILNTVLSEALKVAATPGNKNVSISHANFARNLDGDEQVLIIEYGEGEPGDVARFAHTTHPTHAVITGLAPAHFDRYRNLNEAGKDIFAVADYLKGKQVYVNNDSSALKKFIKKSYHLFNGDGALGWRVTNVKTGLTGTSFTLKKGSEKLELQSGLIGEHQVGFLAFAAAFALGLGLTNEQVTAGIVKTRPFEHRLQPYQLAGAWIIDDTYNGNLEGIRAGTALLKELPATRKIYVTPGLVDQGMETARVHHEMGELIAAAKPDQVVLMNNSVTHYIKRGLKAGNFQGEIMVETNPKEFYTNLVHFVASGDLVVMQNDWPDNYA